MKTLKNIFQFCNEVLFRPTHTQKWEAQLVAAFFVGLCFLAGLVHWAFFFNGGHMTFQGQDWPKEWLYYSVLKEALTSHMIPYHISRMAQETHRFLALPETVLSPQILLLPRLSVGEFVMVNTMILYAMSFLGCLWIRARYNLSLVPFTALFLLSQFNGYITSHLGAGHSMWNGFFFLPFYCLFLMEIVEPKEAALRPVLHLAVTLFAMNLQGSLHVYVWCLLFMALIIIFNKKYLQPLALATVLSFLLSFFRLLPAAITYWHKKHDFVTGYPTVQSLIDAFITMRGHTFGHLPGLTGSVDWWEYDLYVGVIGFVFLLWFGVWLRPQRKDFDGPLAVLTVLSLSAFYALVAHLPIPFMNSERVSSRFLVIVFFFVLIFACLHLEKTLHQWTRTAWQKGLIIVALVQTAFELATHSKLWRVEKIEETWKNRPLDMNYQIVDLGEPFYKWCVHKSFLITALTLGVVVVLYLRPYFNDARRK